MLGEAGAAAVQRREAAPLHLLPGHGLGRGDARAPAHALVLIIPLHTTNAHASERFWHGILLASMHILQRQSDPWCEVWAHAHPARTCLTCLPRACCVISRPGTAARHHCTSVSSQRGVDTCCQAALLLACVQLQRLFRANMTAVGIPTITAPGKTVHFDWVNGSTAPLVELLEAARKTYLDWFMLTQARARLCVDLSCSRSSLHMAVWATCVAREDRQAPQRPSWVIAAVSLIRNLIRNTWRRHAWLTPAQQKSVADDVITRATSVVDKGCGPPQANQPLLTCCADGWAVAVVEHLRHDGGVSTLARTITFLNRMDSRREEQRQCIFEDYRNHCVRGTCPGQISAFTSEADSRWTLGNITQR